MTYTANEFQREYDVSRETLEKLETYADLLQKWTRKINLVAPSTISEIWWRHFADSAQIAKHLRADSKIWIDIGSGGGFPGLVNALLFEGRGIEFYLVESDQRKASFLRTVSRETNIPVNIVAERIENANLPKASVVSARALASLDQLFRLSEQFSDQTTEYLFLKGKTWQEELANAEKMWHMKVEAIPSLTENEARLLKITDVKRGET